MFRYLIRHLLLTMVKLLVISAILFGLLAIAPNNPLGDFVTNPGVPPEVRENLRHSLGLDAPLPIRYLKWLGTVLQGKTYSFSSHSPVSELIGQRLPVTLWILGIGYLTSLLLAIPLGIWSALKHHTWIDHLITSLAFIGFSLPPFLTGTLFLLIFSVRLRWFPYLYDNNFQGQAGVAWLTLVHQSVMPVVVLAIFQASALIQFVRTAVLAELPQGYVQMAHAKGLSKARVINVHVLRNASLPVVTLVALDLPSLFGGSLVLEQIFNIPGIGALLVDSIRRSDTPVVMGISCIYAVLVVVANRLADIVYGLLNPQIQYKCEIS